jgi:hypothetical protein
MLFMATSGNSRFTLQTDKNKINAAVTHTNFPTLPLLHIIPLIVKRFPEAAL